MNKQEKNIIIFIVFMMFLGLGIHAVQRSGKTSFTFPASAAAAPLNINAATAEELDRLPGIGPVIASAVIDYRSVHGMFKSIDDIKNVKGIGQKKYERIKPLITIE